MQGEPGEEMYFIHSGSVEVISESGKLVFATMNNGAFFGSCKRQYVLTLRETGEISLLFSCPRTASIRAATNCDLFVLNKADFEYVLQVS